VQQYPVQSNQQVSFGGLLVRLCHRLDIFVD
jgi:hypothetical protein